MEEHERLDVLLEERGAMINLAYRMLGSLAEAEDAVQEAYVRWYALAPESQAQIDSPGAWLTTVVSRICLDQLGSARARRERYVGEWLPEPLPGSIDVTEGRLGSAEDPADRITLDESVDTAFLVVLESMTPAERVAFLLHDVFRYPFEEIAAIVGRTPAACRKLASSARGRVRDARPLPGPAPEQAEVVRSFREAWTSHDVAALVSLLDPAAVAVADGGGRVAASLAPVVGGTEIATYLVGLAERAGSITLLDRTVNGRPGLLATYDDEVVAVYSFEIAEDRIQRIWVVRNPEKLRGWNT
ncbi:MAG: RNA polymerase sigma factor SigJ [Marmoricola sp.]